MPRWSNLTPFLQGDSDGCSGGDSRGPRLPWKEEGQRKAGAELSYSNTALPASQAKAPNSPRFQFEKQVIFSYVLRPVAGREFLKRSCRKEITESSNSPAKWGIAGGHTAWSSLEYGPQVGSPGTTSGLRWRMQHENRLSIQDKLCR